MSETSWRGWREPRAWSVRRASTIETTALVGILIVVAIGAAWLIGRAIPLGWDEAV